MRKLLVLVVLLMGFCSGEIRAQSTNASVTGYITDPTKAVIVGAKVIVINVGTNIRYEATTNRVGSYDVTNLPPGPYRIEVEKPGFKTVVKSDVILHVQDTAAINFEMALGSASEIVTVTAGGLVVNTTDATVSTVVDRQFADSIPLNGRSLQTLIMLTPGVVVTPVNNANQGQFSVNGQRSNANYFTVDGVSANISINGGNGLGQSSGGALPGFSALGGTNTLVSVDALQEFRIQTSSFAPEFGSTPGGQVSIVTRSGTNQFHGTLFEYFRNDVLDAKDWFVNHGNLPKPPDRQNDFGGVLGGPIIKDRTFFFFSYEGLRLRQPKTAQSFVPDTAARQMAPPSIQPFLNAFPVQNGPEVGDNEAEFNASFSNAATLNAYSIRMDHTINSKVSLFGRYNYAPSELVTPTFPLSNTNFARVGTQTFTVGLTTNFSPTLANELRANYSNYRVAESVRLTNFGGAVPIPDAQLFPPGISSSNGEYNFFVLGGTGQVSFSQGKSATNEQRQVNVADNLSLTVRTHQLKFGFDYRWLAPFSGPVPYIEDPFFNDLTGPGGVLSGQTAFLVILAQQGNALLARNFSLYGQDTWRITPRFTLTYGLRWDVSPPLKGKNLASEPFTVTGLNDPATIGLAPLGTPLYNTTYGNFAPRLGLAYQLGQRAGWGTIVRAGGGTFYDLGIGSLGNVTQGFPYSAFNFLVNTPFPTPASLAAAPPFNAIPSPANPATLYVTVPNLKLPRTYEWNAALEQSLGSSQTISLTYIGAIGRELLRPFFLANPNANFLGVYVTTNTGMSDYHALQLKYQRRLSHGLQALASYSFSHSIDNSSDDSGIFTTPTLANSNVDRGNSDFDLRHSFTGALTYDVPAPGTQRVERAILGDWSVDTFVFARSALPVNIYGASTVVTGVESQVRPDVVPGIPFYLYGSQFPGGRAFNGTPNQGGPGCFGPFCPAPPGRQGDFGRNVLRGFGAWQADFAVRRQFHITERLGLQFRAEFFNVFNHPNFGDPPLGNRFIFSPQFGQSNGTLASSLGNGAVPGGGGFSPLYQIGGPRSIQLALKLQF
jgi:hypothetical protein